MKHGLTLLALATSIGLARGQEQLPREEALKLAYTVSLDLAQLQGTPIPTDVDLKRPIALRQGDYGGLFLPESKLGAETIARAGEQAVPIGQLWLHKLTPVSDGQPVPSSKLRLATVTVEGNEVRVPQCALAVRKTAAGTLQMLVYGKNSEPVATAPVAQVDSAAKEPIVLQAERDYSGGLVTLLLFGKYKAQLAFTELEY